MILTPDEAKTKWCHNSLGTQCVADRCMAWRWAEAMSLKDGVTHAGHVLGGKPIEAGFCGLAGAP